MLYCEGLLRIIHASVHMPETVGEVLNTLVQLTSSSVQMSEGCCDGDEINKNLAMWTTQQSAPSSHAANSPVNALGSADCTASAPGAAEGSQRVVAERRPGH